MNYNNPYYNPYNNQFQIQRLQNMRDRYKMSIVCKI